MSANLDAPSAAGTAGTSGIAGRARPSRAAPLGLFALLLVAGRPCEASGAYLLPESAADVRAAFAAPGTDGLTLRSARAGRDKVSLVVCDAPSACHRVRVGRADDDCAAPAGAWCVEPETGDVPAGLLASVAARLANVPARFTEAASAPDTPEVATDREADRIRHEQEENERRRAEAERLEQDPRFVEARTADRLALLLAVATVVLPLLAGLLLGLAVRRGLGRRLRSPFALVLLLVVPVLPWPFVPTAVVRIGMWDLVLAGLCLGLGAAVVLHERLRVDRRSLALGTVSLVAATAFLEVATRVLLPMPPACPPPRSAGLVLKRALNLPNAGPMYEDGLFPTARPRLLEFRRHAIAPDRKVVLHVGDSMVHGAGVRQDEAFPERLNALDPVLAHLNGGVSGAAFDYYTLLTRTWVRKVPTALVVWHVFGNDQTETDASYALCRNGPLFRWDDGRPTPQCPDAPAYDEGAGRPWVVSPAPYALRVLTGYSFLARHVFAAIWRLQGGMNDAVGMDVKAAHDEALVGIVRDELRAQGVAFLLTALPLRGDLGEKGEADLAGAIERNGFVRGIAERQGVPFLDSLDFFLTEVRRDGAEAIYLSQPAGDPHLNPEGHRRYARWLLEHLATVPGLSLPR